MIATETILPNRKFKIKFSTKRIDVDSGAKCEFRLQGLQVDERGHGVSKEKSSMPGSTKRGPQVSLESQNEKRQRMDRKVSLLCATTLKSLTSHRYSWVFSKPVDPVELNIPDYFTIISEPMDLGTIKSKLEKNIYFDVEEFAADVRLTFSNAMAYNPPGNDVHIMAKELNRIFERKWKDLERKWKCEDEHGKSMTGTVKEGTVKEHGKSISGTVKETTQKDAFPKKLLVRKKNGIQKSSLFSGQDANDPKNPKPSQIICKSIGKDIHKGSKDIHGGGHPGFVKACPSLGLVTGKCSICGDITCHCVTPSDSTRALSDVSSEGSEGRDLHACGDSGTLRLVLKDRLAECESPLPRKSDPDSDGAVSSVDSEYAYSSSQLTTPVADASSGEVWSTPSFDVQLSPKKALRAAMLKRRFADTILKAQQKRVLDHGNKSVPLKMQLEKDRLERMQREERARIEAQIKAAEVSARVRAEEELKQQREKERQAARLAIQKMERTIEMENNLEVFKELEMLCGCKLFYQDKPQFKDPLERLGLFIKDEYSTDDEVVVLNGGWEDGENFC